MRKLYLLLACIFLLPLYAESDYQLGEGVQIGSLPIYIGGYFSLDYRKRDGERRYKVDDIALLSYGGNEKLSYMAEIEFKDLYVKTRDTDESDDAEELTDATTIERNRNLYIERLYLDYNFDENYALRVGKYNSPIGFWNLLPINILRETTSNPVETEIVFPKFTTGVDASYASFNDNELKIDLMLQHNSSIDDDYNNYKIDSHYGIGVSYEMNDFTVKANGGYFHKTDVPGSDADTYYALLSGKYDTDAYQIMMEVGTQYADGAFTTEYAAYLQGVYRFTEHHIAVLRFEAYSDNLNEKDDNIAIIGYTYRPLYPVALKSEYQRHTLNNEDQFLFSFSVLF